MTDSTTQTLSGSDRQIRIGDRLLPSRYFLAPLAGYTHLAFRRVLRSLGGVGLCTTDLVQAAHLLSGTRKSLELVATSSDDRPLSVQIFSGIQSELIAAAKWLEDHGYEGVDINMGCPMAKVNSQGGGARLMCDSDAACRTVQEVVQAVRIPVTVKMRLGWDRNNITAPELARRFEEAGVAAITVHGRTRQQGFHGDVCLDAIAQTVDAVHSIPIVGNGDVRTVEDARLMRQRTGCAAIAIGRGAMLDPWIFQKLRCLDTGVPWQPPGADAQLAFLRQHFLLMQQQHGPYACVLFRKFAAWYGATLGIPEALEDKLRRFETPEQFEALVREIRLRHGERTTATATALIKVPNGPVERW